MKYSKLVKHILTESHAAYVIQLTVPGQNPVYLNAYQNMVSQPKQRGFYNGAFRSAQEAEKHLDAWKTNIKYPMSTTFTNKLKPYVNDPKLQVNVIPLLNYEPKPASRATLDKGMNKNVKNLFQLIVNFIYSVVKDEKFIVVSIYDSREYPGILSIRDDTGILEHIDYLWSCIFGGTIYTQKLIDKMISYNVLKEVGKTTSLKDKYGNTFEQRLLQLTNNLPPTQEEDRVYIEPIIQRYPLKEHEADLWGIQKMINLAVNYKIRLPKLEKVLAEDSEIPEKTKKEYIQKYEKVLEVLGLNISDSVELSSTLF